MLKAAIYQRLTRKRFLRDLHTHLLENPAIAAALGFDPYQPLPSIERFSAFLGDSAPVFESAIEIVRYPDEPESPPPFSKEIRSAMNDDM